MNYNAKYKKKKKRKIYFSSKMTQFSHRATFRKRLLVNGCESKIPDLYLEGILKLVPRCENVSMSAGIVLQNNSYFVQQRSYN
jgi:hypothetical protein